MTERLQQLDDWLKKVLGSDDFLLEPASGDASFRRYFRLTRELNDSFDDQRRTFIVMDAPPDQEDCEPFVDIAQRLLTVNINVPEVIQQDLSQGFLLLSDLGDTQYLSQLTDNNVNDLYGDAIKCLYNMQQATETSGLPSYDQKLLMQEMELFREWLLEKHIGLSLTEEMSGMLDEVFALLSREALAQPKVFVHRDYHSRNLMVTDDNNPGVLDFQDAVNGPLTYDLVSLLKDCYIKWPREKILSWLDQFYDCLKTDGASLEFDRKQLVRWFDLMGVQRHLKASGIFARLCHRDGKPAYLADIPRTLSYIVDLKDDYEELDGLITLIQTHLTDSAILSQESSQAGGTQ